MTAAHDISGNRAALYRSKPLIGLQRVGGIWFWHIGRLGGSVYLASTARDDMQRQFEKDCRKAKRRQVTLAARLWQRYGGFYARHDA